MSLAPTVERGRRFCPFRDARAADKVYLIAKEMATMWLRCIFSFEMNKMKSDLELSSVEESRGALHATLDRPLRNRPARGNVSVATGDLNSLPDPATRPPTLPPFHPHALYGGAALSSDRTFTLAHHIRHFG